MTPFLDATRTFEQFYTPIQSIDPRPFQTSLNGGTYTAFGSQTLPSFDAVIIYSLYYQYYYLYTPLIFYSSNRINRTTHMLTRYPTVGEQQFFVYFDATHIGQNANTFYCYMSNPLGLEIYSAVIFKKNY